MSRPSCRWSRELWHGEAFSRFLGEAGELARPSGGDCATRPAPRNLDPSPARWSWELSHVGTMLGSAVMDDFPPT
jgi:hypothetical protein